MTIEQELSKEKCAEGKPEGKEEVGENIERVSKTLEKVGGILNKNKVEYYIGGGTAVYLIAGKELDREHHDIDIFIPQKGISKLKQALEKNEFDFWSRKTHPEETGRHLYGAYDPENMVTIEITSHEMNKFPPEIHQEDFFDKHKHRFKNIELSTITPEYLYWNKSRSSKEKHREEKDKKDMELLKPYVDQGKFQKLENLLEELKQRFSKKKR